MTRAASPCRRATAQRADRPRHGTYLHHNPGRGRHRTRQFGRGCRCRVRHRPVWSRPAWSGQRATLAVPRRTGRWTVAAGSDIVLR